MASLIQVENLTKSYGDLVLFENITFTINEDKKTALIARNGAGKTSLIRIISGEDKADSGTVTFQNNLTVGFLPQEPILDESKTVFQQLFVSDNPLSAAVAEYEQAILSHDQQLLAKATSQMDALNAWDYEQQIKQVLSQLKITDLEQPVSQLSGGQRKRLALANALISKPKLLILDEPTNHLDLEMIEWLEGFLTKSRCSLFMVTHDRYFLDRVCDEILEMDNNQIYRHRGNYSYYLEKREERITLSNTMIEKARNLFKTEREWMNRQPQARATKAKARIENFYKIKERASQSTDQKQLELSMQTQRLGGKVLEAYNLSKRFGDKVLVDNFSYKFVRNEKIGIVGKNGVGKTTFLNLLTEALQPDSGHVEAGETVAFGYYRQQGIKVDEDKRVIDVIKEISESITLGNGKNLSATQFLEYFLFNSEMQYGLVARLSGGERRRLYLMTILMRKPNFLILDEPTNDLDIMTLNVLEEFLLGFSGCLILVSHDRFFMDKVVDNLFVFEGEGKVTLFPGNYSDYRYDQENLENEKKRLAMLESKDEKAQPKQKRDYANKFSYKDQVEFDKLEKDLASLAIEKSEIEQFINSGTSDHNELLAKSQRLSQILETIDEKELRWLELSELKEKQ
jgi:ABC transport system ATP-binding/permease protein